MKIKSIILPLLAIGCVAMSQIGSANAYFTTYVTARGGYDVSWEHKEKIDEEFHDWTKYVTISSREDSVPVFVRAKALSGTTYNLEVTGNNWKKGNDGYYYYTKALPGGGSTEQLLVKISNIPTNPEVNDNFNVAVVYESIPATFFTTGEPTDPEQADWSGAVSGVDNREGN